MAKDDHYGQYNEYDEHTNRQVYIKPKKETRTAKVATASVFVALLVISFIVTAGYLIRKIRRRRMQKEQSDKDSARKNTSSPRRYSSRPVPTLGSKI